MKLLSILINIYPLSSISFLGQGGQGCTFLVKINEKKVVLKFLTERGKCVRANEILNRLVLQLSTEIVDVVIDSTTTYYGYFTEYACCNHTLLDITVQQKNNKHFVSTLYNNMLAALHTIHDKGLYHADIKPDNMLCHPQTLFITLIDFDGSCFFENDPTCPTKQVYTPDYYVMFDKNISTYKKCDIMAMLLSFASIMLPDLFKRLRLDNSSSVSSDFHDFGSSSRGGGAYELQDFKTKLKNIIQMTTNTKYKIQDVDNIIDSLTLQGVYFFSSYTQDIQISNVEP